MFCCVLYCFVVVVDVVVVVDLRNLSLKFGQNWVSNRIADIEFPVVGEWTRVIFVSNPTFVE